jgi:DNA-directed RNA polymerase subunit RPC12/RpoP
VIEVKKREVKIDCYACGKVVKIPQFIDTDEYDGQIVCQECKSLLHVKLAEGKVQKYKVVENKSKEFNFTKVLLDLAEKKNKQEKEQR